MFPFILLALANFILAFIGVSIDDWRKYLVFIAILSVAYAGMLLRNKIDNMERKIS
jgi:hypothetical protein